MAGAAGRAAGVVARNNLRKPFRPGGIGLVAGDAKFGRIGENRFLTGKISCVPPQRTMAGLASDPGMRTFALRGYDVVVTALAGFTSCEHRSPRGDFVQRRWPEMTVLAELRGNEEVTQDEETGQKHKTDQCQSDQVLPALEDSAHAPFNMHASGPFAER